MFTRLAVDGSVSDIQSAFDIVLNDHELNLPAYNLGHNDQVPVIVAGSSRKTLLVEASWSGIADLAPVEHISRFQNKQPLAKALQRKRCIIPVTGFYVWKHLTETSSIPFLFRMLGKPLFGLAGVYDTVELDGVLKYRVTGLETDANSLIEPLSDRMPAIIRHTEYSWWLDPLQTEIKKIEQLTVSVPIVEMSSYRVGNKVNDRNVNDKSLIQPVV
jgi:putative SOS response-associated peptidase YedK